jgi:hypothetical protein
MRGMKLLLLLLLVAVVVTSPIWFAVAFNGYFRSQSKTPSKLAMAIYYVVEVALIAIAMGIVLGFRHGDLL